MTTYTWFITQMDIVPSAKEPYDVVQTVHWRLRASDQGVFTESYGTVCVNPPNLQNYTPYGDLALEQVVDWVQQALGDDQVNTIKQNLENGISQILAQRSPTSLTPPWETTDPVIIPFPSEQVDPVPPPIEEQVDPELTQHLETVDPE